MGRAAREAGGLARLAGLAEARQEAEELQQQLRRQPWLRLVECLEQARAQHGLVGVRHGGHASASRVPVARYRVLQAHHREQPRVGREAWWRSGVELQ